MAVYKTYKKIGESPLEALNRVVLENNIPENVPVTFAGRLDPAAEGEMVFLSGETVHEKDNYIKKDKIYLVEYVLGVSTDTGDLLGRIKDLTLDQDLNVDIADIKIAFVKLSGKRNQNFHKFSSKVVDGKPLWQHAKEGREIFANHEVNIYSIDLIESFKIKISDIAEKAINLAGIVNGEFRQDLIIKSWQETSHDNRFLPVISVRVKCSSGTYMRTLGEELSEMIGVPVCAYNIKRESILL